MSDASEVKSKLDIVSFISEFITLKKAGRNFKANCPFHSEKTPSFTVSPERQTWHCFGACNEGGDAIRFLEKWENIDFLEALKILAQRTGVKLQSYVPSEEGKMKDRIHSVNLLASEYFGYLLQKHKVGGNALDYLKSRGIEERIIKTFGLGYAPNSWNSLSNFLKKKGYEESFLALSGLAIRGDRGGVYDRFRGRLIFTLKDHRGNTVGFSGRVLPGKGEESKGAKYINTPETPVYIKGNILYGLDVTREEIKKKNEAIIVEGEFDMISSFQSGVGNVVAIKGSALTEGHVMLLKRFTENLALSLDADIAGNEAAKRGIELADQAGLNVKVIKVKSGKDPADCISEGAHLWKESVSRSVPVYDFIIESALTKYDVGDISGKRKITEEAVPFIAKIGNPVIKSHYIRKLAGLLSVSEESVSQAIEKQNDKKNLNPVVQIEKKPDKRERNELMEEHLLSLVIQSPFAKDYFLKVRREIDFEFFLLGSVGRIFKALETYFTKKDTLEISSFSKSLEAEVLSVFDRAFLIDIQKLLANDIIYKKEFEKTLDTVSRGVLRRKINFLTTKIKESEEAKDDKVGLQYGNEVRDCLEKIKEIDKSGNT